MTETMHVQIGFDGKCLTISTLDPTTGAVGVELSKESSLERINKISEGYRSLVARRSFADETDKGFVSALQEVGKEIYSLFFADLESFLKPGMNILLSHNIYLFPLELAFDGHEFAGIKYSLGNWFSRLGRPRFKHIDYHQRVCNMFLLGDNHVANAINPWHSKAYCDSLSTNSRRTILDLLRHRDYDILHFACHAYFNEKNPSESFFILGSSPADREASLLRWSEIMEDERLSKPIIFANFCQSGHVASDFLGVAGIADAFLRSGASSCIATQWSISDEGAIDFASEFYSHLMQGEQVGEALRRSRASSWREGRNLLTSLSYILFGDPRMVIQVSNETLPTEKG